MCVVRIYNDFDFCHFISVRLIITRVNKTSRNRRIDQRVTVYNLPAINGLDIRVP